MKNFLQKNPFLCFYVIIFTEINSIIYPMNRHIIKKNLARQDGEAVARMINPMGKGAFVLVCEHASNYIPPEYDGLGLSADLQDSHIAWDPGAVEVAQKMSALLDSPLVVQDVSRLVIDCNRPPMSDDATPVKSEIHPVPGNVGLSEAERRRRAQQYYEPFCTLLSELLKERLSRGQLHVLLTVHSFSPVYKRVRRDTGIGLIDHDDPRFADAIFTRLCDGAAGDVVVQRNAPYSQSDGVTHTLSLHAKSCGLLHVMIEIRNNLITSAGEQTAMAQQLAAAAQEALVEFVPTAVSAASA